jgi:TolA-binding protein
MKKVILLISFLTLSWNSFSQTATTTQPSKNSKKDSTEICLPAPIARQVAKDLIQLDGCKEEIKLLESKVVSLQDMSKVKDVMLQLQEDKDKNNQTTIKLLEKQVGEYDNLSNDLNKEIKGYKVKSFLWKVGTFVGIITTSYLLIK